MENIFVYLYRNWGIFVNWSVKLNEILGCCEILGFSSWEYDWVFLRDWVLGNKMVLKY